MKLNKFFLILISAVLLTSAFTGCGNNDSKSSVPDVNIPTDELVQTVISSGEWPKMAKVDDNDTAKEFFKLDLENENYAEISIWQCPMSASLAEVIIIKAVDGKIESVKNDLKARQDKLINADTFYPDQKNIAEESIVGDEAGYVYFIAAESAEDGEKALIEKVNE